MGIEDIFTMQDEPEAVSPEIVEAVEQLEVAGPVEEVQPVIEAPIEREEKSVPLPTFLDMRDKQKETERRANELERQIAEMRNAQQPKVTAPDPFDDPVGFAAYNRQQLDDALFQQKMSISYEMAAGQHGRDTTEAARIWALEKAQSDPAFDAMISTEMKRQINPLDWIVRQHKRDSVMQQIGEDPDEYVKRRAAELGLTATTQEVAPAVPVLQQQAATPARSLASSPSLNGGVKDVPVGPMTALSSLFK